MNSVSQMKFEEKKFLVMSYLDLHVELSSHLENLQKWENRTPVKTGLGKKEK